MKMRKLFAGIAAAATMLGGMALGATAASAANGQPTEDTFSITFTAEEKSRLENRSLTAYKLADYVEYITGTDQQTKQYAIQTVSTEGTAPAIREALGTAVAGATPAISVPKSGDPMAWASQQGVWDQSTKKPYAEGTMGGKGVENDNVVSGSSRKFADALLKSVNSLGEGTKLTVNEDDILCTAGESNCSATATPQLALGIWLIVDGAKATVTGDPASDKTTSQAIAMIVSPGKVADDHRIVAPDNNDWTVTIDMKNEVTPVTKAVADKDTVPGVGDTRVWTITSNVPNWVGKDLTSPDTKFLFTDTPGKGQTVDFSTIKITIGDSDANIYDAAMLTTKPGDADKWNADGTSSFVLTLTDYLKTATEKKQAPALDANVIGKQITVTYSSTVNADAVTMNEEKITNKVEVNNNGGTAEDSAELPKPVSFMFTKVNADNEKLAGAHFSLTRSSETGGAYVPTEPDQFMKVTGSAGAYTINPSGEPASGAQKNGQTSWYPLESGEDGVVKVSGVGAGTYKVKETAAPVGYWNTALPTMTIVVADNGTITFSTAAGEDIFGLVTLGKTTEGSKTDDTATVKNIRNITQLPLTGAAGIAMFTVVGLLVLGAGMAVYAKSRSTRKAMMA